MNLFTKNVRHEVRIQLTDGPVIQNPHNISVRLRVDLAEVVAVTDPTGRFDPYQVILSGPGVKKDGSLGVYRKARLNPYKGSTHWGKDPVRDALIEELVELARKTLLPEGTA